MLSLGFTLGIVFLKKIMVLELKRLIGKRSRYLVVEVSVKVSY